MFFDEKCYYTQKLAKTEWLFAAIILCSMVNNSKTVFPSLEN